MEIESYAPENLAGVTALYNDSIADVPHAYPVGETEMRAALAGSLPDGKPADGMREERVWVAREEDRLVGYIHAGPGLPRNETTGETGILRYFAVDRGRRAAGQSLLAVAEEWLWRDSIDSISTFDHHHAYPFHQVASSYLSERIANIHALLGVNGYRPCKGEVILEWRNFEPPSPEGAPVDCETVVTHRPGRFGQPILHVQAIREGREIGVCDIESIGERSHDPEARAWAFVNWLGVEEAWRGKGLGRHTLASGLSEARRAGYRHVVITTDWRNYRAFVFYCNAGFRLSDWTYRLGRERGD